MQMVIPAGPIKRIHVNRAVLADNKKYGLNNPAITIQTSKGPYRAAKVKVYGVAEMVHSEKKPLSCGARVWLETRSRVIFQG